MIDETTAAAICIRGTDSLRLNGERIVERILAYAADLLCDPFAVCKMARASNDVSRIVCANIIQENEKRLLEARIKNQVYIAP